MKLETLVRVDAKGTRWAPGAGYGKRWKQPDGGEFSVIAQGDTFDVYIGRQNIYNVTLDQETARAFAWWVIRWWVLSCWCGLKLWLWERALAREIERDATTEHLGR